MMRRKRMIAWILGGCLLLLSGCASHTEVTAQESAAPEATSGITKVATTAIGDMPLTDDASLYTAYDPLSVVCFYATIRKGSQADGTDHTFAEVNSYLNLQGMTDVQKIKTEVLLQIGDENGPQAGEIGYGETGANATLNVRGRTSTGYPQKSYRIDLFDTAGLWRGQRAIALNKHPGDPTRLRNMLFFELLQKVPGITSLRTQFVHLYVKDETVADAPDGFVDYGLYTQVELPNGRYLRNHGLSVNGNLYKANLCEMFRYPDNLRLATDPLFSQAAFDEVLEPKTGDDHSKLLKMLDDVNDYTLPIEEVIGKHFNLDNLTSYMAFNILMANPDSNAQNYLLYSPVNSDVWYYLCWDGDGSLSYSEDRLLKNSWVEGDWEQGISDYWAVSLFNRMLRVAAYRDALTQKVEMLHRLLTSDQIASLVRKYRTVVDAYTARMPDQMYMQVPTQTLEQIYEQLPYDTDEAYANYQESLNKPMPFYLTDVTSAADGLTLRWDPAYDFDSELIRYTVRVATDWTFDAATVVWQSEGQLECEAAVPTLPAGTYCWQVVATNESGYSQTGFDQLETDSGIHSGMRRFTVNADGSVVN